MSLSLRYAVWVNMDAKLSVLNQMGHNDLGDHYYNCGDLANAQRSYTYTRDYCASSSHIVEMCLNVIKVK